MSSEQLTNNAAPTTLGGWRELANRAGDGLDISLWWSNSTDRVKVIVVDERRSESFDLDVAGADALYAFYHPFAYAAGLHSAQLPASRSITKEPSHDPITRR